MSIASIKSVIENATEPQETLQEAVARLAALPPLEYEQVRDTEAKKLNVKRVSILDGEVAAHRLKTSGAEIKAEMFPHVMVYPHPVDGVQLLNDIRATVKRFIVCDEKTTIAVTLWIAFTWVIDHVQVAPLGVITAPEKRCGKSQLLNLIGRLCLRPMVASNISPAATYRLIEAHKPTLLIDEADSFFKENEELRGVINSGHTRQSAFVIRTVGDEHEPKQFSTWGAKAVSGIGALAETLMDRAIIFELRRKLPHEKVERLRHAENGLFERLSPMLARWAQDNGNAIARSRPALPDALNDRAQDNWEPLLAIADCVGGEWPKLARNAALAISGNEGEAVSLSAELLADIREVFNKNKIDRISTADLLQGLNEDELAPWATYNRGKPMSPRQLAKRLNEYGIKPDTLRVHGTPSKGYALKDFDDVFARYLCSSPGTPDLSVTPLQNAVNEGLAGTSSVTDKNPRYGNNNPSVTSKSLELNACYSVTDKNPSSWEETTI